jgi:hypothetical protein
MNHDLRQSKTNRNRYGSPIGYWGIHYCSYRARGYGNLDLQILLWGVKYD